MMLASSLSRSTAWRVSRVVALRSFSSTTAVQEQYDVVVVGKWGSKSAAAECTGTRK